MVFLTQSTTAIPRLLHVAVSQATTLIQGVYALAAWTLGLTKWATGHLDTYTSTLGSAEAIIATLEHFVANLVASRLDALIRFEIIRAFTNMADTFTGCAPERPARLHAASRWGAIGVDFLTVRHDACAAPLTTRREISLTAGVWGLALIGRNFTIIVFESLT
jgi:hypothetical protein